MRQRKGEKIDQDDLYSVNITAAVKINIFELGWRHSPKRTSLSMAEESKGSSIPYQVAVRRMSRMHTFSPRMAREGHADRLRDNPKIWRWSGRRFSENYG
jgi:hypothetical protein